MDITGGIDTGRLTESMVLRARAEAAEWSDLLTFRDVEMARIDALASALDRVLERSAMVLSIGQAMGLSEAQVHSRIATGDRVRSRAPQTWLAFHDGRVDAARVREIAGALDRLERPESWIRLDQSVIAYASCHTVAELRAWLRRFVIRVEEDLALERAEQARAERHVEIVHVEDSMAWINAFVPSHVAAAIEKRLVREARAFGSDDPRTKPQRMADLLAAWCTTSESVDTSLVADIAVTMEADVLSGLKDGFAASSDGSWAVPASWILETALTGSAFWQRMLIDPVTKDVLAHQYVGRYAPDLLEKAIQFRDGICRAPGCRKPAEQCDKDHREPWPTGPTVGSNLWALCRRHHSLKGHQLLRWVLPDGTTTPAAGSIEHQPQPDEPSLAEHRLATAVIEYVPERPPPAVA